MIIPIHCKIHHLRGFFWMNNRFVLLFVPSDVPPGSVVTQVVANDVDLSSTVTYQFLGDLANNGSFAIDRYTGVISVTRSLDHEEVAEYVLRVQASDSVHQAEADVHVHVLDVNDNAPVFSQQSYQV